MERYGCARQRSAKRYAVAGEARAAQVGIHRIRRRLGLSQAKAAELTGGGHNVYLRYERGESARGKRRLSA